MQIVLIRHGESTANAVQDKEEQIFTGQWDCDLTEQGRLQALALRDDPVLHGADAWYCSDLKRTVETASLITDRKIVTDPRLRERSLGDFEGKKMTLIEKDPRYERYFSDPSLTDFRHSFTAKAPGGENYSDVQARTDAFLRDLGDYDKIVVVSHFCAIRCIVKSVTGLSEEETLKYRVYNCRPLVIEYDRKAR